MAVCAGQTADLDHLELQASGGVVVFVLFFLGLSDQFHCFKVLENWDVVNCFQVHLLVLS